MPKSVSAGLLSDGAGRAARFLRGLESRPVFPSSPPDLSPSRARCPRTLPIRPQVLDLLDRVGSPATVASAGGRYFGFVTGGSLPAALPADWLASAWDQNAALWVMSPVAARLEETVLEWLAELFGLPAGVSGGLVTSTTMGRAPIVRQIRGGHLVERCCRQPGASPPGSAPPDWRCRTRWY